MKKDKKEIIKKFDKMLLESREYPPIMLKLPAYLFEGISFLFFMVVSTLNDSAVFLGAVYFILAISMHLNIYMVVNEKNKKVSIYHILRYFPVSPWDIFQVRLEYLWKILWKRLLILWALQVPMVIYAGTNIVWSIFFPPLVIIIVAVFSVWGILPKGKRIR